MIADRVRQTSGGGLPAGARHLMHFENNVYDSIQKQNGTIIGSDISFSDTIKKFGNYSLRLGKLNAGRIEFPNSIIDWSNQNFTIGGWLQPISASDTGTMIANVYSDIAPITKLFRLIKNGYSGNNVRITIEFTAQDLTEYTLTTGYNISATTMNFVKFGRKDGVIFLVTNGVKATDGNPNILDRPLKTNTTEPFKLGDNNDGASYAAFPCYFDEWLVQLGVGDDSLDIPTAPY